MPGMDGCCSNETETYVLEEEFGLTNFDFNVDPDLYLLYVNFNVQLTELSASESLNFTEPQNTGPPFVEPDIFVQVQSFLL